MDKFFELSSPVYQIVFYEPLKDGQDERSIKTIIEMENPYRKDGGFWKWIQDEIDVWLNSSGHTVEIIKVW